MMTSFAHECVNSDSDTPILLLCDHASNAVPPEISGGSLGLPDAEMARHIAWDVGARGVTVGLAERLGATALLTRWSRLVIDPNRGEDDPTLVMRLYDGTIVPANRQVDAAETRRRIEAYHRPYHGAIHEAIGRREARGQKTVLVAIHSFTPSLRGQPPRPWHVGVLSSGDRRLADPVLARLRADSALCVGDNVPYSGHLPGDTLDRHGIARGLAHVLIEVRNDLIADAAGQALWAERLAPILHGAIGDIGEDDFGRPDTNGA